MKILIALLKISNIQQMKNWDYGSNKQISKRNIPASVHSMSPKASETASEIAEH